MKRDTLKNFGMVCLVGVLIIGGVSSEEIALAAEEHIREFPSDFDRLKTILQQPRPLSTATPEWLDLGIEHRTRYETFKNSFTVGDAGSSQQIHQRTRIFLGIKDIVDPLRFTLEVADFRTPVADRGQEQSPIFVNHLDIFQLHLDLVTQNFLGTGISGKLEVGRLIMDFGKGRLVAGHRFGSFTPTFDGVLLTMGGDHTSKWGIRTFVTRPVQRHTVSLDSSTSISYFSGAAISSRHVRWANGELYIFQLNEGNNL